MIYAVSAFRAKKNYVFLASNILVFVSNKFAMLHITFYKLRLGIVLKVVYNFE